MKPRWFLSQREIRSHGKEATRASTIEALKA